MNEAKVLRLQRRLARAEETVRVLRDQIAALRPAEAPEPPKPARRARKKAVG